ncbi:MAG: hypothetical protein M1833_001017, partial [Piccolia ochrophora]
MTGMDAHSDTMDTEALFRPSKRRKFYRKRVGSNDVVPSDHPTAGPPRPDLTSPPEHPLPTNGDASDAHADADGGLGKLSLADIMRLRKAGRQRRGGIEFTTSGADSSHSRSAVLSNADMIAAMTDPSSVVPEDVAAVVNRFAPQTGEVSDVNKHIARMAYIDAELAKRQSTTTTTLATSSSSVPPLDQLPILPPSSSTGKDPLHRQQPAALGKLQEIDLGPAATLTNIARTEAAARRLGGGPADPADDELDASAMTTTRLGRDGKPLPLRRGQKRRTSADIRRDKLVEEILKETR